MSKRIVWDSNTVEDTTQKMNDGYVLKTHEIPFFDKIIGLRKAGLTFKLSKDEIEEYMKCKLDIKYFANNYCYVKSEDGQFHPLKLRDYQYDMLDLFDNNKLSILMASRQVGKTISSAIFILHFMLFNNTKNVLIAANVLKTSVEILERIKEIYQYLPFFLKQGIEVWNQSQIKFENGSRAKAFAMTKTASIGQTGDLVYIDEFAHIPSTIVEKFYKSIFPTLVSVETSKMIITSTPDGLNLFHKLLTDAERDPTDPQKNNFAAMRVYWYQVPGRNVSYIKLHLQKLHQYYLTEEMILEQCIERFNPNNELTPNGKPIVELKRDPINGNKIVHIQNSDEIVFEREKIKGEDGEIYVNEEGISVKDTVFINSEGEEVPAALVADLSTWKLDAIKDIGGIDAFNQEYDLRFINAAKSVLSETTMERLNELKIKYEFEQYDEFMNLKWSWDNLKWNPEYSDINRKNTYGLISVDVSEGLGQDYSVINMFELGYKPQKLIEKQQKKYQSMLDFFQLKQIGMFRSNVVSIDQLAEILYLIVFEFFDPDKFKVIVEYNNDGKALLASLKSVFDQENDYGPYVIMKFKHRIDAIEKSLGLKVSKNKNKFVKDYQIRMENQEFMVNEETTLKEIGSFIAHTTPSGNTVYKGDGSSNDDTTMTLVNLSQGWNNNAFKEIVQDFHDYRGNKTIQTMMNEILKKETKTGTDYNAFFNAKKNAPQNKGGKFGNKIDLSGLF